MEKSDQGITATTLPTVEKHELNTQTAKDLEHGTTTAITATNNASSQYSAFTLFQKRSILTIVAFAGTFSSLSSFIYFPAIPSLAHSLSVSTERINLTVTAYLIASGIFPSLVGDAADRWGRRPVLIATLTVYVGANVGLALQSSFAALFALRMLQSAGISGSYAVTYGVIGDLFTPSERGGYSGLVSFFLNTPPSIGPVISGLLMERWGWRSIFWFLSAVSPCCLVLVVVFLPETSRIVVRDGSMQAPCWNRPVLPWLTPRPHEHAAASPIEEPKKGRSGFINPSTSLKLLYNPSTAIITLSVASYYTIYSCLQASLSSLFTKIYHTSGSASGLIYLPFGVACAISAFVAGKILDYDYRRTAAKYGILVEDSKDHDLQSFPIEEARLKSLKYSLVTCCIFMIGYGWSLKYSAPMAVPLVLQFLIGLTMQGVFTALSTLLVDTHPDCPSTAQAASNFVRCEMAAGGLALLDVLLRRLGAGWSFVLFAALGLTCIVLLYLVETRGMVWRTKRRGRAREREVIGRGGTMVIGVEGGAEKG